MDIFISSEDEQKTVTRQHRVLVVSVILDAISLIFLVKHTPSLMADFRKYLLLIQMIMLATDIHMDLLFLPIPLFPLPAGYCLGLLCQMGIPIQKMTGVAMLLLENVGIAIMLCVLYRHQAVLLDNDRLKLKPRTLGFIRAFIFIFFNSSILAYIVFGGSTLSVETDKILHQQNVSWVQERVNSHSQYITYVNDKEIRMLSGSLLVFIFLIIIIGISLFSHIFYALYKQERKRSIATFRRLQKSVIVLIAQLLVPLNFTVIPGIVIFTGITFENTASFELSSFMFFIQSLHSIGHNLILFSITPAYRGYIVDILRFCFFEKHSKMRVVRLSISTNALK